MKQIGLSLLIAASLVGAGEVQAQNFFERLFGIAPSRPSPPPPPPPAATFSAPAPQGLPADEPAPRRAAPAPSPARPVAIKAPNEETVLGRDLKQNGTNGSLRLDRPARSDLRLRLTVVGRRAAGSVDMCSVALGGAEGLPLVAQGRPEGAPRYQAADPACPLQVDILDEAVLVKGPTDICVFPTASCQADPSGLWGPEPAQLLGKAREYEQARGTADKAVRDNYKVMSQRAGRDGVRPIVTEQASFSSDREMICRSYAREGSHSFCNSRLTEARALSLATRLGVSTLTASSQQSEQRSRRRNEAMGLPSSEELMQRRPADLDDE